ncbi:unnamed protein product [Victoria cruziana]
MTRPSSSRGRRKNREELAILARSCPSHLFSLFTFFLLSLISSLFMFLLVACPSSSSLTVENIRRRHGLQGMPTFPFTNILLLCFIEIGKEKLLPSRGFGTSLDFLFALQLVLVKKFFNSAVG